MAPDPGAADVVPVEGGELEREGAVADPGAGRHRGRRVDVPTGSVIGGLISDEGAVAVFGSVYGEA